MSTKGGRMKFLSNLRNRLRKNLVKNQRGQGMTEYILLLVVVVGIILIFKNQISDTIKGKMGALKDNIDQVRVEP